MSQRDVRSYLTDIVESCDRIARHTAGEDYAAYVRDEKLRDAVERRLFILGEAVNQLRLMEPLEVHTLGDVEGIVGVRNLLAHSYFRVQHDLTWDMIVRDVPRLRAAAQEWLNQF